jgi:HTH-type transcriptional regulator, competence development regulator
MKMSRDRNWLLKRARQEDQHIASVGGLAARLADGSSSDRSKLMRAALLRLIQLSRREKQLTIEEFANKADINVAELILIDNNPTYMPAPRTIYKLSHLLNVPSKTLSTLAGMVKERDVQFEEAAIQFAANSEPMEQLSSDQIKILRDYIKFLSEREK